jgi:hypothetical protein
MKPSPHVIPIEGEWMRVFVQSRSRPKILHLVDVEDGDCGCEDAEFDGPRKRGEIECYHLTQARKFVTKRILAQIAAARRRAGRCA